jgi:hypothetical protein
VCYPLKTPYRDGTMQVVLELLELMAYFPVRHLSGDLWSCKSGFLQICHGRTGGTCAAFAGESDPLPWSIRAEQSLARGDYAGWAGLRSYERDAVNSHHPARMPARKGGGQDWLRPVGRITTVVQGKRPAKAGGRWS